MATDKSIQKTIALSKTYRNEADEAAQKAQDLKSEIQDLEKAISEISVTDEASSMKRKNLQDKVDSRKDLLKGVETRQRNSESMARFYEAKLQGVDISEYEKETEAPEETQKNEQLSENIKAAKCKVCEILAVIGAFCCMVGKKIAAFVCEYAKKFADLCKKGYKAVAKWMKDFADKHCGGKIWMPLAAAGIILVAIILIICLLCGGKKEEPVAENTPVVEQVVAAEPVVEPVAQPEPSAPVVEPEPVAEPEAQPVEEPVAEVVLAVEPVAEPVIEPVVEPQPIVEEVVEEPVAEPEVVDYFLTHRISYYGYNADIEAHDGYARLTYPKFVTNQEIDDAAKAAYRAYGKYLNDVTYTIDQPGLSFVYYAKGYTNEDFTLVCNILDRELPLYVASLFAAPAAEPETQPVEEPVAEVVLAVEPVVVEVEPIEEQPIVEEVVEEPVAEPEVVDYFLTHRISYYGYNADIEAHDGYARLTYPKFVTNQEIDDAAKAAYRAYGKYLNGVTYTIDQPGLSFVYYAKGYTNEDFTLVCNILDRELPMYVASLFAAPAAEPETQPVEEPVAEIVLAVEPVAEPVVVEVEPIEEQPIVEEPIIEETMVAEVEPIEEIVIEEAIQEVVAEETVVEPEPVIEPVVEELTPEPAPVEVPAPAPLKQPTKDDIQFSFAAKPKKMDRSNIAIRANLAPWAIAIMSNPGTNALPTTDYAYELGMEADFQIKDHVRIYGGIGVVNMLKTAANNAGKSLVLNSIRVSAGCDFTFKVTDVATLYVGPDAGLSVMVGNDITSLSAVVGARLGADFQIADNLSIGLSSGVQLTHINAGTAKSNVITMVSPASISVKCSL